MKMLLFARRNGQRKFFAGPLNLAFGTGLSLALLGLFCSFKANTDPHICL